MECPKKYKCPPNILKAASLEAIIHLKVITLKAVIVTIIIIVIIIYIITIIIIIIIIIIIDTIITNKLHILFKANVKRTQRTHSYCFEGTIMEIEPCIFYAIIRPHDCSLFITYLVFAYL